MTSQNQQYEFSPWEDNIKEEQSLITTFQYPRQKKGIIKMMTPKRSVTIQSKDNEHEGVKKLRRYLNVLPKVYQPISNKMKLVKEGKQETKKEESVLKPVCKSDIILHPPQDAFLLPRVPVQHHIKHSLKVMKQVHMKSSSNLDRPLRNQKQQLTFFRNQLQRSSTDTNQHHANMLKRMSEYEQQIVKKCSLKNLQIYDHQTKPSDKSKCLTMGKAEEKEPRLYRIAQKKHILDRILARLQ